MIEIYLIIDLSNQDYPGPSRQCKELDMQQCPGFDTMVWYLVQVPFNNS